jgi:hypothetical protein
MNSRFRNKLDFSALSLKDLIEARDAYHVQLANLPNVIGTALGRYLYRADDPRAKDPHAKPPAKKAPRTIDDVTTAPWSWPAVLVFVDQWQELGEFHQNPQDFVPPRLDLPDGRSIPVCVVSAPTLSRSERTIEDPKFADGRIAVGNAILRDAQEQERIGTVSCLATDGADIYALTSAHVVGDDEQAIFTIDTLGQRKSAATEVVALRKGVLFTDAYPGWPSTRTVLNVDVGMVRIKDVSEWSATLVSGLRMGPVIDLSADTLNLDLIGCPLFGYGAASGKMIGQIAALFYRYRSIGGTDYVADVLIGPREPTANVETRPGDSGAVWLWDAEADNSVNQTDYDVKQAIAEPRPIAIQWGGYSGGGGGSGAGAHTERQFALATSLALACRLLEVEFIRDLGYERGQFWGKTGHYKVAWSACELVQNKELNALLMKYRDKISVSDDDLVAGNVPMNNDKTFIALADVADLYWRSARPNDAANHFADMDNPNVKDPNHPNTKITLLDAWTNKATRNTDYWNAYYDSAGTDNKHKGALPFRAWEVYELLVGFARDAKLTEFICAAGCVGHYLGDACQPLHVSYLHHGHPGNASEEPVHAIYETQMLDRFVNELIKGVNAGLKGRKAETFFAGGLGAAEHVIKTMAATLDRLDPELIIKVFNENTGRERLPKMWEKLSVKTVACIVEGAVGLAEYWESAWKEGRQDPNAKLIPKKQTEIQDKDLMKLYRDRSFMPSKMLSQMKLP